MPTYTVHCPKCGATQDIYRPLAEWDDLPDCCGQRVERVIKAPMIISDIQPYKAVAVDVATGQAPVIRSREHHREFLKRNGYVEIGNEKIGASKPPDAGLDSPRGAIIDAFKQATGKI